MFQLDAHAITKEGKGCRVNVLSHHVIKELTGCILRYEPEMEAQMQDGTGDTSEIWCLDRVYWIE